MSRAWFSNREDCSKSPMIAPSVTSSVSPPGGTRQVCTAVRTISTNSRWWSIPGVIFTATFMPGTSLTIRSEFVSEYHVASCIRPASSASVMKTSGVAIGLPLSSSQRISASQPATRPSAMRILGWKKTCSSPASNARTKDSPSSQGRSICAEDSASKT